MKQLQRSFLMLLIFALGAIPAPAQQKAGLQERLKRIEQMIQQEMQKSDAPGLAVAIEQDGKLVYSKGFGYADVENKVPFTPQTVSRIGSISKTFTALSVMQLVEQGKIKLDDEVQVYVPTFPKKSAPITIRQLLCHQSGIRHYKGQEFLSSKHYATVEEALGIFKDDPLGFEPGTQFGYTTYGYVLLSRVVEAASGETFPDYLTKHIFTPLGLKVTWLDDQPRIISQRARNYTKRQNGPLENSPQVDQSNKWGGGGLLSTVEDLLRYADSYDGKQMLKPETIAQMFTAQKTRDGKTTAYGLGWGIALEDGRRLVEHTGGSAGATSALSKYPEQKTTIAVLVNNDFNTGPQFRARIAKILFEP
ncbi:MAG TPA: serine hydrolase domain-containing protein [Blastocatellia bacterium]|nr:serine hydrolase domain-containing protein [Blastocatellia bacterium]